MNDKRSKQDSIVMRTPEALERKHKFTKKFGNQSREIRKVDEFTRYSDAKVREEVARQYSEILDYVPPFIDKLRLVRCASDGIEDAEGDHIKVVFSASVSDMEEKNTAKYKLEIRKNGVPETIELADLDNNYTVLDKTYVFAALAGADHSVELVVTDKFRTVSKEDILIFDGWRDIGLGAGYQNCAGEGDLPLRYRKNSFGICELLGDVSSVSEGSAQIAVLPAGFRPKKEARAVCMANGSGVCILIGSDGNVAPNTALAADTRIEIYACFPAE